MWTALQRWGAKSCNEKMKDITHPTNWPIVRHNRATIKTFQDWPKNNTAKNIGAIKLDVTQAWNQWSDVKRLIVSKVLPETNGLTYSKLHLITQHLTDLQKENLPILAFSQITTFIYILFINYKTHYDLQSLSRARWCTKMQAHGSTTGLTQKVGLSDLLITQACQD